MTKIYYFSGTGNSLWSAKKIAEIINGLYPAQMCTLYNIGKEARKDEIIIEAETVVIIFPSFAYGPPSIVSRFVRKAEFKTRYLAAFTTYGSSPLGTMGILRKYLLKKKIEKMYFGKIPAVENYLAMFGTPGQKKIESRTNKQKKATEKAAVFIIEKKENKVCIFTPFSSFVSWLFSFALKIFYKYYKLSEACSGCAVCAKICPVSAIEMKNGCPVFSSECEHCQGCVNICPSRAIQFARVKFGTPGYCHPEIKIKDLIL